MTTARSLIFLSAWVLSAGAILGGCVERQPDLSPADRERLREFVSNQAPNPGHPLEVQLANGVRLLGYDVEPEEATPGQPVTITWYWHAAEDLDSGWQMFTHVADANGENRLNQDGVGMVRRLYQPDRWEAGQYIRDVQAITLPDDWNSDRAVFYLGLWKGDHRLAIRSGPHDGENRVRALSLPVRRAPSARTEEAAPVQPPPTVRATHVARPPTIDGDLDEEAWRGAGRTEDFVNTLNGSAAELRAHARVTWDADKLYVAFDVRDDFVRNSHTDRDAPLGEQDAVEIMVDPDGDGRNYFDMQVSPAGVVFDTRYDSYRQPGPVGHVDYDSGLQAAVRVQGTANDDGQDEGYTAEIAIPWQAFNVGEPAASAPQAGATWRMNFYVRDARPSEAGQRSAGWSPTHRGHFHVPARFGQVVFEAPRQAAADEGAEGRRIPQVEPEIRQAIQQQIGPRQARITIPPPSAR